MWEKLLVLVEECKGGKQDGPKKGVPIAVGGAVIVFCGDVFGKGIRTGEGKKKRKGGERCTWKL